MVDGQLMAIIAEARNAADDSGILLTVTYDEEQGKWITEMGEKAIYGEVYDYEHFNQLIIYPWTNLEAAYQYLIG